MYACFFKGGGRVVTTDPQQKPTKTITARVTARTTVGKTSRHNLQVTGVPPPNSSVIVERHYAAPQVRLQRRALALLARVKKKRNNLKQFCSFIHSSSRPRAKPPSLSFSAPPSRAAAPAQAEAHPGCTPACATHTPSKWLTDPTSTSHGMQYFYNENIYNSLYILEIFNYRSV